MFYILVWTDGPREKSLISCDDTWLIDMEFSESSRIQLCERKLTAENKGREMYFLIMQPMDVQARQMQSCFPISHIPGVPKNVYTFYIITVSICIYNFWHPL
jgi:hypothetical protein